MAAQKDTQVTQYLHKKYILKCNIHEHKSNGNQEVHTTNELNKLLLTIKDNVRCLNALNEDDWTICINSQIIKRNDEKQFKSILSSIPSPAIIDIVWVTPKKHSTIAKYFITVHCEAQSKQFVYKIYENENDWNQQTWDDFIITISKHFNLDSTSFTLYEKYVDNSVINVDDIDDIMAAFDDLDDTYEGMQSLHIYVKITEDKSDVQPGNNKSNIPTVLIEEKEIIYNTTDGEKDEKQNCMEVVPVTNLDITCECDFKLDETKLYFCNKCDMDSVYCQECGVFLHRASTKKDHKWGNDIVEIQMILSMLCNSKNYQDGLNKIIHLIGVERYKIIAPYVRALATHTFTVNNGFALVNSAGMLSASYNLSVASKNAASAALKASKCAIDVTTKSLRAQETAQIAMESAKTAQEMKEMYTIGWSKNPAYWLYDWLYMDKAEEARVIYQEVMAARDVAQQKAAQYAQSALKARKTAETAKQLSNIKQLEALKARKFAQESMGLKLQSSAWCTAGLTAIEMFIHGYKWGNNEITGNEFWRLSGKSLTRNTASAVAQIGVLTATQLGVQFCDSLSPGFGAIAASGVGLIAGMVLSWKLGKIAENAYERIFPCQEEKARKQAIHEALIYFHFTEKDIDNSKVFNEKRIKKEYRNAALSAHPDRNDGDHTKWNTLSTYYGIVMGLLEQNNKNKKIVKNTVIGSLNVE
eukprot:56236_1